MPINGRPGYHKKGQSSRSVAAAGPKFGSSAFIINLWLFTKIAKDFFCIFDERIGAYKQSFFIRVYLLGATFGVLGNRIQIRCKMVEIVFAAFL
jgi:hypothetical protein